MAGKPLKIVLLGEGRAGKTSLVCRFANDSFDSGQLASLQASFVQRTLALRDRQTVEAAIWDTAGQERFHSLGPIYYRNADAAILVYDVTSAASFERVRSWIKELKQMVGPDIALCIAANKQDTDPRLRAVPHAESAGLAAAVGASHWRTSARTGEGCQELFMDAAQRGFDARSTHSSADRSATPAAPGPLGAQPESWGQRHAIIVDDRPEPASRRAYGCC